jgi:hypothetical protein
MVSLRGAHRRRREAYPDGGEALDGGIRAEGGSGLFDQRLRNALAVAGEPGTEARADLCGADGLFGNRRFRVTLLRGHGLEEAGIDGVVVEKVGDDDTLAMGSG